VKRNSERFPKDFMFRLTAAEYHNLRSQIATSKQRRGGRRYLPFAFTEYGAIMAASVLNSERAVEMSLFVVRAFVRLREMLSSHRELAIKLSELERKLDTHDHAIQEIIDTIRELTELPDKPQKQIGFRAESRASLKDCRPKREVSAFHIRRSSGADLPVLPLVSSSVGRPPAWTIGRNH